MSILLLLVPLSVMLLGLAIWAFAWAVRKGQFDDLDTPALDILVDTRPPRESADPPPAMSPRLRGDDGGPDAA